MYLTPGIYSICKPIFFVLSLIKNILHQAAVTHLAHRKSWDRLQHRDQREGYDDYLFDYTNQMPQVPPLC